MIDMHHVHQVNKLRGNVSCLFIMLQFRIIHFLCIQYQIDFSMMHTSISHNTRGRSGRDFMVVGFIITYAISAYHH